MDTNIAKSKILSKNGQFNLVVDVDGMLQLKQKAQDDYDAKLIAFSREVAPWGLGSFNVNSTKDKKALLSHLGIDTTKGASKLVYESRISEFPILQRLADLSEAEHLRRCLWGSKKGGDTIFDSFTQEPNGRWIFNPEMVMTDGRLYQNQLYAMPYPMRRNLLPYVGKEFLYFDLHAAELTLLAYMSNDKVLLDDCMSGNVWNYWYQALGITKDKKPELKRGIYSCVYSLSDYSIPYSIGKRFFVMFFKRYGVLFSWLKMRQSEAMRTGKNLGWDGQLCTYDLSEHNVSFKVLNHPIQFGLANYVMQIAAYLMDFCYVSAINFDSVWVAGITMEELNKRILEGMELTGMKFGYKTNSGSNFAEAQGE